MSISTNPHARRREKESHHQIIASGDRKTFYRDTWLVWPQNAPKNTHNTKKTILVWITLAATSFFNISESNGLQPGRNGARWLRKKLAQKSDCGKEVFECVSKKSQNTVKKPPSANNLQEAPPFSKNSNIRNPGSTLDTNNTKKDHGQPFSPKRPVGTRSTADFRQKRGWTMVPSSTTIFITKNP